jgi:hypothetical protein
MDEASRLVSELNRKLAELDQKVLLYRRVMATEFTKYAEDTLRGVPNDISESVLNTIATDEKKYTSLNPIAADRVESCEAGTSSTRSPQPQHDTASYFTNLAIPESHHTTDGGVDSPTRSPHEREVEFQGLFTPTYLPLLDSTSRSERRPSYGQFSPTLSKGKEKEMRDTTPEVSTEAGSSVAVPRPSTPRRRNTDEASVISNHSDHSDGPTRRSALRRSSSSTKTQSPRRVRFDFAGSEVLPTASPLPKDTMMPADTTATSSSQGLVYESDEDVGSEQIEDIDSPPPPKIISSSQALRALSRAQVDDGTEWHTVSQALEDIDAVAQDADKRIEDREISSQRLHDPFTIPESNNAGDTYRPVEVDGPKDDRDGDSSDEEMLAMPSLKRVHKSEAPSTMSPIHSQNTEPAKSPTARSPSKPFLTLEDFVPKPDRDEDDLRFEDEDPLDELFHFDENIYDRRSPPEEDYESESPVSPPRKRDDDETEALPEEDISMYATSPIRAIPSRQTKPDNVPVKGVVGTYNKKPFSMPIVNEELHTQALSLGNMTSIVGSVHGPKGMDENDVQSFRESFRVGYGSLNGVPKSLSERMMMEALREEEEAAGKKSQS